MKNQQVKKTRRNNFFIVLAFLFSISALGVYSISGCVVWLWPQKVFESSAWKETESGQRYVFARDIEDRKEDFIHKTEEEIISEFGPPSYLAGNSLAYTIRGYDDWSCFFAGSAVLWFYFDHSGRMDVMWIQID